MLTRFSTITRDDDSYLFELSNEGEDRHGTIIRSSAWDLTNYRKNPIVLYMHSRGNTNPDNIIGKGEVFDEDGKLMIRIFFEPENELAEKIKRKVDFGSLNAVSVGFRAIEGHWADEVYVFDRVELMEASIVDIPSNVDAVKKEYRSFLAQEGKGDNSSFEARYKFLNI